MINEFKVFESKGETQIIATNESYWSWEDDSDLVTAEVSLDKVDGYLYLKIKKLHTKHGIGSGSFPSTLVDIKIGTIQKPELALVRSLLKEHGHKKSSSSYGFKNLWKDEEGNNISLSDIIKLHKPEKPVKKLKHIDSISDFEKPKDTSIEIVQYSDRSYAIFGEGTKAIKEELKELGCRYNKFLTDPNTGNKRAGWICSIGKINSVKKLIGN